MLGKKEIVPMLGNVFYKGILDSLLLSYLLIDNY